MSKAERDKVFLDIDIAGFLHRIVIELFNDIVPKTCENFRLLCTGLLQFKSNDTLLLGCLFFSLKRGNRANGRRDTKVLQRM